MFQDLFAFISGLSTVPAILCSLVCVLLVYAMLKFILIPAFLMFRKKVTAEIVQNNKERGLLVTYSIRCLHLGMQNLEENCHARGYRDTKSDESMGEMYSTYLALGGNHDGELIWGNYKEIPYKAVKPIPMELGSVLPNKDVIRDMLNNYSKCSNENK